MKLSAVGKLGGLAALDKNLEDLDVVRPRVLPAGEFLRFEAGSFDLLFGGDTAIDDAVHRNDDIRPRRVVPMPFAAGIMKPSYRLQLAPSNSP